MAARSVNAELQSSKLASAQLISRQQHPRAKEVRPTHLKITKFTSRRVKSCTDTHSGPRRRAKGPAAKQIQFSPFSLNFKLAERGSSKTCIPVQYLHHTIFPICLAKGCNSRNIPHARNNPSRGSYLQDNAMKTQEKIKIKVKRMNMAHCSA